jgi:hypothetical protein
MHTDSLPHPATGTGRSSSRERGAHTRGRSQHDSPAAQLLCAPDPMHASPSRFVPVEAGGGAAGGGAFGGGGGSSPSRGGRAGGACASLVPEGCAPGEGEVEGCTGDGEGTELGAPGGLVVVSWGSAEAALMSGLTVGRSTD